MIKIKVAFQGGGAKLITLIECAMYLSKLREKGQIEILEVSGTSAGSIAASLLAMNANFKAIKEHLKENEDKYLKDFSFPNTFICLSKLFFGYPIFSNKLLLRTIDEIICKGIDQSGININETDIPLRLSVVSSDLVSGEKKVFSQKFSQESGSLVEALTHSCSIPLAFRAHKQQLRFADGGICENLPIEELEVEDGVINIAIGFEKDNDSSFADFKGVKDYAGKVVSASISHNVDRSENSSKCHHIIKLPNTIDTLDFKEAFKKLNSDDHLRLVENIVEDEISKIKRNQLNNSTGRSRIQHLKKVESMQSALTSLEHAMLTIRERGLSITPYCLFSSDSGLNAESDHINQFYRITPKETLFGFTIKLAASTTTDKSYSVSVEEVGTGHKVNTRHFILDGDSVTELGNTRLNIFIFFEGGLSKDKEYKIVASYRIPNAFFDFKLKKKDYLVIHNENSPCFEKVTLIMFCPPELKNKIWLKHYEDLDDKKKGYTIVEGNEIISTSVLQDYSHQYCKEINTSPLIWQYCDGLNKLESIGVTFVSKV